jgi:hypothetical protein
MRREERCLKGLLHQVGYVPVEKNIAIDVRDAVVRRELRKLIDKEPDESGNAARAKTVPGGRHEFRYVNELNAVSQQTVGNALVSLACSEMKNETVRWFLRNVQYPARRQAGIRKIRGVGRYEKT